MAFGEAAREHGGQENLTKALVAPRPSRDLQVRPKKLNCLTIVALAVVGPAEVAVRQRVQHDILAGWASVRARWAGR